MGIPHRHLGMVKGEENVREVYENADVLVSASSYETLPGTLVEAQAYGCIPVSFDQGGRAILLIMSRLAIWPLIPIMSSWRRRILRMGWSGLPE